MNPKVEKRIQEIEKFVGTRFGWSDGEIRYLLALVRTRGEALESIASSHRQEHGDLEHWKKLKHLECAVVLVNDTVLAREALSFDPEEGK